MELQGKRESPRFSNSLSYSASQCKCRVLDPKSGASANSATFARGSLKMRIQRFIESIPCDVRVEMRYWMVGSGSMPSGSTAVGWVIGMFARILVPFGPDSTLRLPSS